MEHTNPALRICQTDQGVRFGLCQLKFGDRGKKHYFRQSGTSLAHQGWQCVSIDLPCHGWEHRAGEPEQLDGWRFRSVAGEDFVEETNRRLAHVLDHLNVKGCTDAGKVAVCGTSRGGFLAMHFAAFDSRVKCVAAFAPVTDLLGLQEFHGAEQNDLVRSLALTTRAVDLARKQVWMVIGDQDVRVGTDRAIMLADRITEVARDLPVCRGSIELHVLPEPRGHTTPAGATDRATEWIDRQISNQASVKRER